MTGQGAGDPMPGGLLGALAVVRFLAELGLLFALGWVGFHLVDGATALGLLIALLLSGLAAAVWGTWVGPRSPRRLRDPARLAVEVALFTGAVLGLLAVGPLPAAAVWASVLAVAYALSAPVGRKGY